MLCVEQHRSAGFSPNLPDEPLHARAGWPEAVAGKRFPWTRKPHCLDDKIFLCAH